MTRQHGPRACGYVRDELFAAPAVELPPDAAAANRAASPRLQRRTDSGLESGAHEGQLDRGRVLPGVQPRPRDA